MNHIGGNIALTMGLTKWLEGYAGTSAYANSDSANQPSLLQVLGDTDFGLKAFGHFGKILHVGGAAELWLINGTGAVGLDGGGTSAKFRAIATADLRGTEKHTPLRFGLNLTYSLDNSGDVVNSYEAQKNATVTRIERYGLNFNRVDHFDVGLGVEGFFVEDRLRPFLEYNIMIPVNRQNYQCPTSNPSGDNCLALDSLAPSKLTIGARVLPWKHGFSLLAAFDIGITGQNDFIQEMSPIPPWTLYLGAGWSVDTWDRPKVVETKIVEKATAVAPVLGHIKGYVDEAGHPETGVPNAIVAFTNHPELTSLASGADGHFTTLGLPAGKYDLTVKAEGYKDGTCTATLAEKPPPAAPPPPPGPLDAKPAATDAKPVAPAAPPPGIQDTSVTCSLEALPRIGKVAGRVRDAETRNGVPSVEIKLADTNGHEFTQTSDANGTFHFPTVLAPAGCTSSPPAARGYMNDVESVDIEAPRRDAGRRRDHEAPEEPPRRRDPEGDHDPAAGSVRDGLGRDPPRVERPPHRDRRRPPAKPADPQGGDPGPHRQQRRRSTQPGSQRGSRERGSDLARLARRAERSDRREGLRREEAARAERDRGESPEEPARPVHHHRSRQGDAGPRSGEISRAHSLRRSLRGETPTLFSFLGKGGKGSEGGGHCEGSGRRGATRRRRVRFSRCPTLRGRGAQGRRSSIPSSSLAIRVSWG